MKERMMPKSKQILTIAELENLGFKSFDNSFWYKEFMASNTSTSTSLIKMESNPITVYKKQALQEKEDALYIGFDTEYYYEGEERFIISYSISTLYKNLRRNYLFFPISDGLLSLAQIQQFLTAELLLPVSYSNRKKESKVDVYLIGHNLQADIKTIKEFYSFGFDLISSGGLFSIYPYQLKTYDSNSHNKKYVWNINFRDTFTYFKTSLEEIGNSLGLKKLGNAFNNYEYDIAHMDHTLRLQTQTFIEYAVRDTEILIEWVYQNYNQTEIPTTAPAYGLKLFVSHTFNNDEDQLLKWRGLRIIEKQGFNKNKNKKIKKNITVEYNPLAKEVQDYARMCYIGGFNTSINQGYYEVSTYDYDLQSAYPTAKSLIPTVDFDKKEYLAFWGNGQTITKEMSLQYPYIAIGFGRVAVKFPKSCEFPCIGVKTDHGLIFPKEIDDIVTDWCSLKLAINMGAEVKAHTFKIYPLVRDSNDNPVFKMAEFEKIAVLSRNQFKKDFGKKSNQELMIKLADNGLYGKTAQAVQDKSLRDLKSLENGEEKMDELTESKVSNPYVATYTTSLCRNILIANMQQLTNLGYKCFSVTTDGFITDAPLDVLNSLDGYGLNELFRSARLFLTGIPDVWEIKHQQARLLNITTRGNIGFDWNDTNDSSMVQAHTGYKGKDGAQFIEDYLNRGKNGIEVVEKQFTSYQEQLRGKDFRAEEKKKNVTMNFDFKRKVNLNEVEVVEIEFNGKTYNILNYTSHPYRNIDEYNEYRNKLDNVSTAIITFDDLENLFNYSKEVKEDLKSAKQALMVIKQYPEYKCHVERYIKRNSLSSLLEIINDIYENNNYGIEVDKTLWENAGKKSRLNQRYINHTTMVIVQEMISKIIIDEENLNPVKNSMGFPYINDRVCEKTA